MNEIKTSLSKFKLKLGDRSLGFGTNPEADWKIILISTFVLALAVVALSIFIFVGIDGGEIFAVDKMSGENEAAVNVTRLREIVLHYQNKRFELERIKNVKPKAPDPSI